MKERRIVASLWRGQAGREGRRKETGRGSSSKSVGNRRARRGRVPLPAASHLANKNLRKPPRPPRPAETASAHCEAQTGPLSNKNLHKLINWQTKTSMSLRSRPRPLLLHRLQLVQDEAELPVVVVLLVPVGLDELLGVNSSVVLVLSSPRLTEDRKKLNIFRRLE